ncbi:beta-ketoacyl-ACP synthase 3 [Micromonospora tulbaghiae]|uniref:Beta-ketoacyl-[acyl-carrier-protein] synthase III n=1 Tax=Micromonospora tulbaghiae TaxID=479978 RepID=A0AAW4J9L1_9ACTN|nr:MULTISPECIES: beta-ketoacyl-ACP synthase 3 [Micromonospora]KAB1910134.1 beta-ketoacyl-ACP synthase III [Micromonospora sp. AMSO1212t]MBO4138572.1 beta-ketoacyl-ACP synthase 3 [Micromonospora tulbaghiae]MDX5458387.1 beta-ketoacyl-ACP synthase 3 [Micromonospora tulbaghiae]SCE74326.1 3-oxoacyl-[acyl-carrier-protein] synthase III [Micromonospora tulbaghiae]
MRNWAGTRVAGLGYYQPPRVLTNEELSERVDTDDAWIRSRVGIERRHVAEDQSVADMATAAAGKALSAAGVQPGQVDLVVVATCTAVDRVPNVASRVAANLEMSGQAAYDVNTACSGFSYALATADHAIRAGAAATAVVIGAERLTDYVDWQDRSTCILFGDGAGAAVLVGAERPGVGPVVWGGSAQRGSAIRIEGASAHIEQDGKTVFHWATTALTPVAREACRRAGVEPEDLAAFVPHQANLRIINAIARDLGVTEKTVIARDIVSSGNTSSASTPIALAKLVERREVPEGAPVLLLGFGGGLTFAGQVVTCP